MPRRPLPPERAASFRVVRDRLKSARWSSASLARKHGLGLPQLRLRPVEEKRAAAKAADKTAPSSSWAVWAVRAHLERRARRWLSRPLEQAPRDSAAQQALEGLTHHCGKDHVAPPSAEDNVAVLQTKRQYLADGSECRRIDPIARIIHRLWVPSSVGGGACPPASRVSGGTSPPPTDSRATKRR